MAAEIETIDLSMMRNELLGDRSFDARDVRGALDYLKNIRDESMDYVVSGNKLEIKKVDERGGGVVC